MRSSAAAAAAAAAATAAVAAATGLSDSDRSGRRSFASSHSSDSLGSAAATLEDPHQRGKERQQLERGSRRSVAAQQGSSLTLLRTSPAFLQDTDEAFMRAATERGCRPCSSSSRVGGRRGCWQGIAGVRGASSPCGCWQRYLRSPIRCLRPRSSARAAAAPAPPLCAPQLR